jgi:hypothetical protein
MVKKYTNTSDRRTGIELKTTNFVPEYAGKMQFYLAVLDDKVKQKASERSERATTHIRGDY